MRKIRTQLEDHFVSHLTAFLKSEFNDDVALDADQYDNPDALYLVGEKRIAVELSQFPSSYILHSFNVPLQHPTADKHFCAERVIYPFEPHRWVHKVIEKKAGKLGQYKSNTKADEYWLVMHAHTSHHDAWPMSGPEQRDRKILESHLMRFGAQLGPRFDRVIYIYPDGSVAPLTGYGLAPLDRLELSLETGYPAVVAYRLMIKFDVPNKGAGRTLFKIPNIGFVDRVIAPTDADWEGLKPDIQPFSLSAQLLVDNETAKISLNGGQWQKFSTAANAGQIMNIALLLHGDLSDTEVSVRLPLNDPTIDHFLPKLGR